MTGTPSTPAPSEAELELQNRQLIELRRLDATEARRLGAIQRGRSGRLSLLSGGERGVVAGEQRRVRSLFKPDVVLPVGSKDIAGGPTAKALLTDAGKRAARDAEIARKQLIRDEAD